MAAGAKSTLRSKEIVRTSPVTCALTWTAGSSVKSSRAYPPAAEAATLSAAPAGCARRQANATAAARRVQTRYAFNRVMKGPFVNP